MILSAEQIQALQGQGIGQEAILALCLGNQAPVQVNAPVIGKPTQRPAPVSKRKPRQRAVAEHGGQADQSKYGYLWDFSVKPKRYLGKLAPVGQNAASTHQLRKNVLDSLIPGFSADVNVRISSQGKAHDGTLTTTHQRCVNIPFTYIGMASSKKCPIIAGIAHSEVCRILNENGYKFSRGNKAKNIPPAFITDSAGHPAMKKWGKPQGAAASALNDE